MIIYILKTICCSAFFLAIYFLLLEKAKMPRFNRAYLVLSLLASFGIPFITFTTEITVDPLQQAGTPLWLYADNTGGASVDMDVKTDWLSVIATGIYFLVAMVLLFRFVINIFRLLLLIRRSPYEFFCKVRVVLLEKKMMPFSFFNCIFLGKDDFRQGLIEKEVMHHELEHVKQLHSIDIILIELISIIAWFNPFLVLYRKAIQLNHEFLADDAVVAQFKDPYAYQLLLLNKAHQTGRSLPVSNPFSYKITKKRLVMITNPFNSRSNLVRCLGVMPCVAFAVLVFSEKVIAEVPAANFSSAVVEQRSVVPPEAGVQTLTKDTSIRPPVSFYYPYVGGTKEGASADQMAEYASLTGKYAFTNGKGHRQYKDIGAADKARLLQLFSTMNKQQQESQEVAFLKPVRPVERSVPSKAVFKSFLDSSTYGIWIDNKHVPNEALSKYKNTDFGIVFISKLYGKAKEGRSYTHRVDLMTNDAFDKNNKRISANKEPRMVIRRPHTGN